MKEYIGSQQHFEDQINEHYDELEKQSKELQQRDDRVMEYKNLQINQHIVCSTYPDAHLLKYAKLSLCIWSTFCKRLSGFFYTEEEAWEDAVKWIAKKAQLSEPKIE